VLVTAADLNDHLLPAGNLREPLDALDRAGIVVLREEEEARVRPVVEAFGKPIWVLRRRLSLPHDAGVTNRPMAFCAIARPTGFSRMLAEVGCNFAGFMAFPDHHRYRARDIARLVARARQAVADGFLTTEKDAVKLTPEMLRQLQAVGPVIVARLEVDFLTPEAEQEAAALLLSELNRERIHEL
jgi:tetraacyldisaccharide 4'-kinase